MKFKRHKSPPPTGRRRSESSRQSMQSPTAFSYYARRAGDQQNTGREIGRETVKPHEPRNIFKLLLERIGLIIMLLAIAAGTINSLALSPSVRIVTLTSGSEHYLHDSSTYSAAANSLFAGSVWNRNKLTVDTAGISRKLQAEFPELASVSVALPMIAHRPVVYLQPSQPVLVLNTRNGGFVVGQNGVALLAADQLPPGDQLDLPVVDDQTGIAVKSGQLALTPDNVSFIQLILGELKAANFTVSSLTLPAATSELDVHLTGQSYFAKFNLHASLDDARQQAGTFIAVARKLASQNITPTQYVDARVDGRAYYQ